MHSKIISPVLGSLLCFVLIHLGSVSTTEPVKMDYTGAQVLKVTGEPSAIEDLIDQENLDAWGGNRTHRDIFVPKEKLDYIKTQLKALNLEYTVMIEDVQNAINMENTYLPDNEEKLQNPEGKE